MRLARIVALAKETATAALGANAADAMIDALVSVADYKGDFAILWRGSAHRQAYEEIVTRAVASEGEEEVVHEIDTGQ
ncbi:hypothetical protein P1X14_13860 [Sphingomonas sp. AOB5]|uniref:hypothetical protein n=1 Tax=Sphingomonas sp. AOB5 TaxID=3034017 RepID=UPI0023F9F9B5|nr:hypothetical protein [Sphingomonas sp. AOB5]MDF7776336.1 hypothetical protein [Sphingomonas sp. AOB5]